MKLWLLLKGFISLLRAGYLVLSNNEVNTIRRAMYVMCINHSEIFTGFKQDKNAQNLW